MYVIDIVSWVLAAAFVAAGATKLVGLEFHKKAFRDLAYPQWLRVVVGAVEVTGALLLLLPAVRPLGAAMLVVVTLGAVHAHVFRERVPGHAVPPGVLGLVAAGVAVVAVLGM